MLDSGYGFIYLIYPNLVVEKKEEEKGNKGKPDIEKPIISTIVKTFKKAVASGRGLFSSKNSEKADTILDPFEFRYLARLFDPGNTSKGPDRLCADMISGKLHPSYRYFEVPKENRLFFDKKNEKIALKKYIPA